MLLIGLKHSLGSIREKRELSGLGPGLMEADAGLNVLANKLLLSWIVPYVETLVLSVSCLAGGSDRRTVVKESCSARCFTLAPSEGFELLRCRRSGKVGEGVAVEVERDEACLWVGV